MSDEFLTVREIAERLKVNEQSVRNWIDAGDLAAVWVGARRVRVRQSDVDAFLPQAQAGGFRRTIRGVRSARPRGL